MRSTPLGTYGYGCLTAWTRSLRLVLVNPKMMYLTLLYYTYLFFVLERFRDRYFDGTVIKARIGKIISVAEKIKMSKQPKIDIVLAFYIIVAFLFYSYSPSTRRVIIRFERYLRFVFQN